LIKGATLLLRREMREQILSIIAMLNLRTFAKKQYLLCRLWHQGKLFMLGFAFFLLYYLHVSQK